MLYEVITAVVQQAQAVYPDKIEGQDDKRQGAVVQTAYRGKIRSFPVRASRDVAAGRRYGCVET